MFTADAIIDAIQNGKKQFVKTFVTNETMATSMNQFVDSQAEYTKKAYKASTDAATVLMQEAIKVTKDASKFDYSKFGEGIMKAYQTNLKKGA